MNNITIYAPACVSVITAESNGILTKVGAPRDLIFFDLGMRAKFPNGVAIDFGQF